MCNCSFHSPFLIKPVHTDAMNMWVNRESLDHHTFKNLTFYYNPAVHGHENLVTVSKLICDFELGIHKKIEACCCPYRTFDSDNMTIQAKIIDRASYSQVTINDCIRQGEVFEINMNCI